MKTKKIVIIILIVLAIAAAGAAFMFNKKKNAAKETTIKTAVVEKGDIMASVSGDGVLQALTTVDVKSNVGGQITEFLVDEGDAVRTGQIIARIDPADANTALEQSQADMDASQSKLRQAQESLDMQFQQSAASVAASESSLAAAKIRLSQAKENLKMQPALTDNSIKQAQANYDFAKKDLARQKELLDNGFVAKSQVDAAEQKFVVAQAALGNATTNRAQDSLKQMDVDSASAAVKQAEASLAQARAGLAQNKIKQGDITQAKSSLVRSSATLQNAKTQLGYTTITAPRDGVVIKKYIEVGSIVTAGKASNSGTGSGVSIVTLADITRMQAVVNIDETDIAQIKPGGKVSIVLDAFPKEEFRGTVVKIAPQAIVDQNVTSIPVTVEINNPDARMKPGMNATCDFITGEARDVVVVPTEAVKETKRGSIVMVMEGGKPKPKHVKLGISSTDNTEITEGLKEGDVIVLSGLEARKGGSSQGGTGSQRSGGSGSQRGGNMPRGMMGGGFGGPH